MACFSNVACLRLFAVKLWNNVEKVKWWDGEMDWYRAMVKQIQQNGAENTHPCSHGEIVRWWNGLVQSYGETSMAKSCTEYTHTCSHGEMYIWWSGAVQIIQRWNGVMVKRLYSPLTAVVFLVPSNNGDIYLFFTSSAAVSPVEEKIFYEWCCADRLNVPWSAETPFDAVSPCFHPINLYFSFFPPPPTPGGGSSPFAPSCILPLLSVLVLAIYN